MQINGYELDPEQMKPILDNPKISLIIAGAGSGKTLTLLGKIKYLLEHHYCEKEEILCLSFTNETVNDLKKNLACNNIPACPVYTFHKLALILLQTESYQIVSPNFLQEITHEFFASQCCGHIFLQKIVQRKFGFFKKSWSQIMNDPKMLAYQKTLMTFIHLMQNKAYQEDFIYHLLKKHPKNYDLFIVYALWVLYKSEKQSRRKIDFDDMILLATRYLKEHHPKLSYKYIIIDEFQDTSLVRFNLINEILKLTNASLCVVGDDYQAIYRFSGCENDLFLNFTHLYPEAKVYKLSKTYRNSQELINLAGAFIQKNPAQIKKELKSNKHLKDPIRFIYYYNPRTILKEVIKKIDPQQEIMILGRTHYDLAKYTSYQLACDHVIIKEYSQRKIRFLTIHQAKGLESDVVILLNLENSIYGLPCQKKDPPLLSLIQKKDTMNNDEERRLLYVALTRTKSVIYLLIPRRHPSVFATELRRIKRTHYFDPR